MMPSSIADLPPQIQIQFTGDGEEERKKQNLSMTTRVEGKMKKKTCSCCVITGLPWEVQIQILGRVAVESVLRCRQVCKKWNKMILDPWFLQLHTSLSRLTITIFFVHCCSDQKPPTTWYGLVTGGSQNGGGIQYPTVRGKFSKGMADVGIVGSCNGLMCLSSEREKFVLCNPSLGRAHFTIPYPPYSPPYPYRSLVLCKEEGYNYDFGFGYIPSTRQYKIVQMVCLGHTGSGTREGLLFWVCTIECGGDSGGGGGGGGMKKKKMAPPSISAWRSIVYKDTPLLYNFYVPQPAFFNGSIIWLSDSEDPEKSHSIIYFDIVEEKMQYLPLPLTFFRRGGESSIGRASFDPHMTIGVYYDDGDGRNHLYLCEQLFDCVNIWLMEDYKRPESLKLNWTVEIPTKERGRDVKLLRALKDGKLLITFVWSSKLVYYDPNKGPTEPQQFPRGTQFAVDIPNLLGCFL